MKKKEMAIVLAAGMGMRMRPLTESVPKPLISVNGVPMIETVISGLKKRGVEEIIVVVGYLGEQFEYLTEKYTGVFICKNGDYDKINNISSVYAVCNQLMHAESDCFICEADLMVQDETIFFADLNHSCYFGKMVEGHSEDWVFDVDENFKITRVGKVGDNQFNMVGISWFTKDDIRVLGKCIKDAYGQDGYESLFWDDVVNRNLDKLDLVIHEICSKQLLELDTLEELASVDSSYKNC